ncbi:MAG: cytochrome c oxidase subunit II [bacterium]|nr:cytochrome c oxidase subunit II [bacterium]
MGIINELIGIPALASEHGELVDLMLEVVHWFMAILGFGWTCFLVYVLIRFHNKNNKRANYEGVRGHATTHLEVGVVIVEAILLLGFAFPLWAQRVDEVPTGDDVVKVRAVGEKFAWSFHYPGPDGKFGLVDLHLISGTNPVGLDQEDPNGADDFITRNELVLPLGKQVVITISSKDVIHNLALVSMRMSHDAMPGTSTMVWFKPTKMSDPEGWDIICGQLCGAGHALMKAKLHVRTPDAYATWFKENSPAPAAKAAPVEASAP